MTAGQVAAPFNRDDIPDLPLTDNKPVGGVQSGETFLSRQGNMPVKSIKFWSAKDHLVAIEISWHTCESTETYGDPSKGAQSKTLNLAPGELVGIASVWPTKEGGAVAYIELQTTKIQYFGFGTKPTDVTPIKQDAGRRVLIAVTGTVGEEIDSLGFLFLSELGGGGPTGRFRILEFTSEPNPNDVRSILAAHQNYWNETDEVVDWYFDRNRQYTSTQEWRECISEVYGVEASISGGLLGITFGSWSVSNTTEHGKTWSDTDEYGWSVGGKLEPGKGIRVEAFVLEGNCSLDFRYEFEWQSCVSGQRWTNWGPATENGSYKGAIFSKGQVTITNL